MPEMMFKRIERIEVALSVVLALSCLQVVGCFSNEQPLTQSDEARRHQASGAFDKLALSKVCEENPIWSFQVIGEPNRLKDAEPMIVILSGHGLRLEPVTLAGDERQVRIHRVVEEAVLQELCARMADTAFVHEASSQMLVCDDPAVEVSLTWGGTDETSRRNRWWRLPPDEGRQLLLSLASNLGDEEASEALRRLAGEVARLYSE